MNAQDTVLFVRTVCVVVHCLIQLVLCTNSVGVRLVETPHTCSHLRYNVI